MSPTSSGRPVSPATTEAANQAAVLATTDLEALSGDSAARLPRLLEAMVTIGTGPELHSTFDRIVETAARVADCRYAALGVLAEHRDGLQDFVTCGMTDEQIARISRFPDGKHGLLAVVLGQEEPLRLHDLNADPRACGFPPGHPPMRSFLGLPVRVGGEVFGNLYLTEKRGGGDFTDNDVLLIKILATQAGIAIGNARLHEAARQRERWIDGSAALTTSLLAGDVDNALAVVAEEARRLADSAAGIVLLPTSGEDGERGHGEGGGGLEIVAVSADDARGLIGTVVPPGSAVLEQLRGGEPVYIDDAATDPRMVTHVAQRFGPSMMLPLTSGGRVIGTLALPRERGGEPFTEVEKTLAAQFAAQAALALVLADAQRDRERLAVYEDRDRIARDLHDLVIQRLFATGLMLQSTQRRAREPLPGAGPGTGPGPGPGSVPGSAPEPLPGPGPEVSEGIGRAVDELDATIAEIRTAIYALQQQPDEAVAGPRTRVLRETGLAAVPLGFRPSVTFVGPVDARLPEPATKELVAALREALSNAFRHARASRIEVTVDVTAALPDGSDGVLLTVADDGVGVGAPDAGRRSGMRNLARRAENLGGTASWGPGIGPEGAGTTVVWRAPL